MPCYTRTMLHTGIFVSIYSISICIIASVASNACRYRPTLILTKFSSGYTTYVEKAMVAEDSSCKVEGPGYPCSPSLCPTGQRAGAHGALVTTHDPWGPLCERHVPRPPLV